MLAPLPSADGRDPLRGRYKKHYRAEFEEAERRLAEFGGTMSWGTHDYQAFVFQSPSVSLIFYPHRTTAGNHHIRVRDQRSVDKKAFVRAIAALNDQNFSCTFQCSTLPRNGQGKRGGRR